MLLHFHGLMSSVYYIAHTVPEVGCWTEEGGGNVSGKKSCRRQSRKILGKSYFPHQKKYCSPVNKFRFCSARSCRENYININKISWNTFSRQKIGVVVARRKRMLLFWTIIITIMLYVFSFTRSCGKFYVQAHYSPLFICCRRREMRKTICA